MTSETRKKGILALEDGRIFEGIAFGAEGESAGEAVFNTSMAGYQEILTDPSYNGQIVTMTYPLIGNYGVNIEDIESYRPHVQGFVVREISRIVSNWRATMSLPDYLKKNNIVGIEGVDTRALTKHLRSGGAKKAVISTTDLNPDSLIAKAREWPGLIGRDLVKEVTCKEAFEWPRTDGDGKAKADPAGRRFKVVAYDFGIKYNILRLLVAHGCDVTVVPASTTAEAALAYKPDGIFLSNGPGDPEGVPYAADAVRGLAGKLPIFGICLGHQIIALAFGARTFKLKFGHRGANHPVMHYATRRVEITSQNHGFAVDLDSLGATGLVPTHVNLNDQTSEGFRHKELPIFCVQYHPEASPGPHDSRYLFEEFLRLMREWPAGAKKTAACVKAV
jgi:carbamoyl-phosphate synthase small subunit